MENLYRRRATKVGVTHLSRPEPPTTRLLSALSTEDSPSASLASYTLGKLLL